MKSLVLFFSGIILCFAGYLIYSYCKPDQVLIGIDNFKPKYGFIFYNVENGKKPNVLGGSYIIPFAGKSEVNTYYSRIDFREEKTPVIFFNTTEKKVILRQDSLRIKNILFSEDTFIFHKNKNFGLYSFLLNDAKHSQNLEKYHYIRDSLIKSIIKN